MKLTESQRILKTINERNKKKVIKESVSEDDSYWIVREVEENMNKVFDEIDKKFGTEMGYDSDFCTNLCEYIEEQLEEWIEDNSESEDYNEGDEY